MIAKDQRGEKKKINVVHVCVSSRSSYHLHLTEHVMWYIKGNSIS